MDVREKLVELIVEAMPPCYSDVFATQIADHLIAHGVTVLEDCKACGEATQNCIEKLQEQIAELRSAQEWISVKDRLPEKPMKCLVYTKRGEYGGYEITYYNEGFYLQYANVTHWMLLPDAPEVKND